MSDNPYQQPSYDQPVFGQSVGTQSSRPQPPKKKGWSVAFWVILILGIVFILGCGCCGGLFYWGIGFLADSVTKSYGDHPILVEKIGEIESASFNMQATGESEGELVFDLKGSKQNGQLIVREQQGQSFGAARLVVGDEEFELGPSKPMGNPNEQEPEKKQQPEKKQEPEKKPADEKQQTDQKKETPN